MKRSIETEKISKKTPSPMVMSLTLLAMSGRVDKDGIECVPRVKNLLLLVYS